MAVDEEPKPPTASGSEARTGGLKGVDEAVGKALSPGAEAFGREVVPLGQKAGEFTNRVGILLIRTLEPLVFGWGRIADWLEKSISDRLKDVPQDRVVPPNPQIAVPAMQALTYSMEDEVIREMFANLLAADMNADIKKDAHPAFVELIKDLTPADARLLKVMRGRPQCTFTVRLGLPTQFATVSTHYSFSIEGLSNDDIDASVNNLERLGLVDRRDEWPIVPEIDGIENTLKVDHEQERQAMDNNPALRQYLHVPEGGHIQTLIHRQGMYLTPLGIRFARICVS